MTELPPNPLDPDEDGRPRPASSVALLAMDLRGYGNLCRLLTLAHADHEKGSAGIGAEEIARHAEGLIAVVPLEDRPQLRAGSDDGRRKLVFRAPDLPPKDRWGLSRCGGT